MRRLLGESEDTSPSVLSILADNSGEFEIAVSDLPFPIVDGNPTIYLGFAHQSYTPALIAYSIPVSTTATADPESAVSVILQPSVRLVGRVLTGVDVPVADAVVSVDGQGKERMLPDVLSPVRETILQASTGADGRFSFIGIPSGACHLEVAHPSYVPAYLDTTVAAGIGPFDIGAVHLTSASTASVLVSNGNKEPVPDAEVIAILESGWVNTVEGGTTSAAARQISSRTNASGEAILRGVIDGHYSLHAIAPGYTWNRQAGIHLLDSPVHMSLSEGGEAHLTVHASSGEVISNAEFDFSIRPATVPGPTSTWQLQARPLDETKSGIYAISGIGAEGTQVIVRAPKYGAKSVEIPPLSAGGIFETSVTLPRVSGIRGVVETSAGAPVDDADVQVSGTDGTEYSTVRARSATDGTFVFDGVPPGKYSLWANAPGHVGSESVTLDVYEEYSTAVLVRLKATGTLTGALLGLTPAGQLEHLVVRGVPLNAVSTASPTASVSVPSGFNLVVQSRPSAQTFQGAISPDGTYAITDIAPGDYRVSVGTNLYAEAPADEAGPEESDAQRTVSIPSGQTVRLDLPAPRLGRVFGVVSRAMPAGDDCQSEVLLFSKSGDAWVVRHRTAVDEGGMYAFELVAEGQYLLATSYGGGVGIAVAPLVQVGAGASVRQDLAGGHGGIAGQVVDCSTGKPVRLARIHASLFEIAGVSEDEGRRIAGSVSQALKGKNCAPTIETDEDGRFRVTQVPQGKYEVEASGETWLPSSRVVTEVGSDTPPDVTLCVKAGAMVAGRVTTPSGAFPDSISAQLFSPAREGLIKNAMVENGMVQLGPVEGGAYEFWLVDLAHGGARIHSEPLTLESGEVRHVEVVVDK